MAAMNPLAFMPAAIVKDPINEDYGGLGNWYSVVNGVQVTNEAVRHNLPEPDYSQVRQDPRVPALISYPVMGNAQYFIEIDVPTVQPEWETVLAGNTKLTRTQMNTARQVGLGPVTPIPTSLGAEWWLLKAEANGADWDAEIPRLDYVGHTVAMKMVAVYDPVAELANDVTTAPRSAVVSYPNDNSRWIGNMLITSLTTGNEDFVYDATQRYLVHFAGGSDAIAIDHAHIDPQLKTGDTALIVGVAYTFLQEDAANVDSYAWKRKLLNEHEVSVDLYMSLGRSETSRIIVSRHIHRAKLSNNPDYGETRGDSTDHLMKTYRYEIDLWHGQTLATRANISDLFEETYHVLPL